MQVCALELEAKNFEFLAQVKSVTSSWWPVTTSRGRASSKTPDAFSFMNCHPNSTVGVLRMSRR